MPKEKEEFTELNAIAMKEFKTLVEQNMDLSPKWKKTLTELLDSTKTPKEVETIKKLMDE